MSQYNDGNLQSSEGIRFFSADRIIIKELFKSQSLDNLYAFHKEFRLSPAQIANCLLKLEVVGIIEFHGGEVQISSNGREWILKNRKWIFVANSEPYWKKPQEAFHVDNSLARDGRPYRIRMKKLDRPFFMQNDN